MEKITIIKSDGSAIEVESLSQYCIETERQQIEAFTKPLLAAVMAEYEAILRQFMEEESGCDH